MNSGNVLHSVVHAYYQVLVNFTGAVGLTPPEMCVLILAVVGVAVLWHLVSRMRGRAKWSVYGERSEG